MPYHRLPPPIAPYNPTLPTTSSPPQRLPARLLSPILPRRATRLFGICIHSPVLLRPRRREDCRAIAIPSPALRDSATAVGNQLPCRAFGDQPRRHHQLRSVRSFRMADVLCALRRFLLLSREDAVHARLFEFDLHTTHRTRTLLPSRVGRSGDTTLASLLHSHMLFHTHLSQQCTHTQVQHQLDLASPASSLAQ
ncbi:hypothetical protein EXIGLDRAFT_418635 [Exidia glandulosa HHB12029]|uniref:Uncharacterized protein n=1 Tax=Exidia glandulosa HHB12029 TaxID=1314781 RepID=A0A165PU06_EXIGL|nr:hypothetical protein EXIGLDRAFT_418635 [Exidia glandulosa HHB12029]